MCVDNPREGFGELFDTHPSVERRITELVKFAGGHDPGPIALPPPTGELEDEQSGAKSPWQSEEGATTSVGSDATPDRGPWSQPAAEPEATPSPGPWGPHHS